MNIKAGSRLISAVCETEIVIVKASSSAGVLECGGAPMLPFGTPRAATGSLAADRAAGTLLGKRYADSATGLEVLCTKGGRGSLSWSGKPLALLATTPLPSSD